MPIGSWRQAKLFIFNDLELTFIFIYGQVQIKKANLSPPLNSKLLKGLGNRAAVHDDDLAVHKTVAIRAHKRSVFGEFRRFSDSAFRHPEIVHLQKPFRQRIT